LKGLAESIDEFLLKRQRAISPEDNKLYKIVKDPQEAVAYIMSTIKENELA